MGPRSLINTGYGQQLGCPLRKLDEAEKMCQQALKGKRRHGVQITHRHWTRLTTWGLLYAEQGKPNEVEKMYQRALQGYEKALGLENVARSRPAPKTMRNLGHLFAAQGHLHEAKEMCSRACTGFQARLGPSNDECQRIERRIASLDAIRGK